MSEPGKAMRTTANVTQSASDRLSKMVKSGSTVSADKLTGLRLGDSKQVSLGNGWNLYIRHRRVGNGVNEYYASASKYGFGDSTTYSQYLERGGYPGPYSSVRSSARESFEDIKKWAKQLK